MFTTLLIIILSTLSPPQEPPGTDSPSVEFIKEKLSIQRLGLRSGVIEVEAENYYGEKPGAAVKNTKTDLTRFTYRITFDDSSLRGDFRIERSEGSLLKETRCFSNYDKQYVHFTEQSAGPILRVEATPSFPSGASNNGVIDPRLLGLAATNVFNLVNYDLHSYLEQANAERVNLEQAEIRGSSTFKLTFHRANIKEVLWADPKRAFNVVRSEWILNAGESYEITRVIDSELSRLDGSELWFPIKLHYVLKKNNSFWYEDADVRVIEWNKPQGPEKFSLTSINIPPGTIGAVSAADARSTAKKWNGHELVSVPRRALSKGNSGLTTVLLLNALVFAMVAAYFVVRGLHARRRRA